MKETTINYATPLEVDEPATIENDVLKTTIVDNISDRTNDDMSHRKNRPTPKEHWQLGGIVWNVSDGKMTTEFSDEPKSQTINIK